MSTAGWPSELHRLDMAPARAVFATYAASPAFFPLIGAVLEGTHDGIVLADHAGEPRQVYVEHAFGFAQLLGESQPPFEASLERRLLVERGFAPPKVRLYTPLLPAFLAGAEAAKWQSERQRFVLPADARPGTGLPRDGLEVVAVSSSNFDAMEAAFGVALRFWRTREDFLANSLAVVATVDGQPAAICYAAAVSAGRAEIDVLTRPEFRQRGAARLAVTGFIERCRREGITPLWDCFTNNQGSMELCRSAGFRPAAPPYPFFTLTK